MLLRWAVWLHKWVALLVGLQIVFWVVGGLVMVALPIETVRGENRVAYPVAAPLDPSKVLTMQQAIAKAGLTDVVEATLQSSPRGPLWLLRSNGPEAVIDARTGGYLQEIAGVDARRYAAAAYAGPGKPTAVQYFDTPPNRSGATEATWRVTFDDPERTAIYISSTDGRVLSRRSNLWSAYDLAWKLHILNFKDGDNYNHPTLLAVTVLTVIVTFSGVVLLWIRIGRDLRAWSARRGGK